jgi:hypothetical protein
MAPMPQKISSNPTVTVGLASAGRAINPPLLLDLPSDVDPCGENGRISLLRLDGPISRRPVRVTVGEVARGIVATAARFAGSRFMACLTFPARWSGRENPPVRDRQSRPSAFSDFPTRVVDASEEMWRFFRRFTRPGAPPLAPPAAEDDR